MSSSRHGSDNRKVTLKMIGAALAVSMLMVGAIAWSRPASAAQAEAPRASAMGGTAANVLGDSRFDATAPAAGGSDEVPRDARSCAISGTSQASLAGEVLLWGDLMASVRNPTTPSASTALCSLEHPELPLVGFGPRDLVGSAYIDPVTASLIYTDWDEDKDIRIRRFVPDPFGFDATRKAKIYPPSPKANDPEVLARSKCPADRVAFWVMQARTGKILYPCSPQPTSPGLHWYDASGRLRATGVEVLAWNESDRLLAAENFTNLSVSTLSVIDPSGNSVRATGLKASSIFAFRAHGAGFHVAARNFDDKEQLWNLSSTGVATLIGTYAPPPTGVYTHGRGVLDSTGAVYEFATISTGRGASAVLRRPTLPGATTMPYSELNAPPAPTRGSEPPLYTWIHISKLVTRP